MAKNVSKKLTCSFFGIPTDLREYVRGKLKGHKISMTDGILTSHLVKPDTQILGVFVDSRIPKDMFAQLPKLKMVAAMSTGYDHIDLAAAKRKKIVVSNVPTYGENTVAEHAMALILALSRRLFESVERVKKDSVFDYHGLRGFDLKGKTVGVIGTGHIGLHLIKMLNGFDTRVIGYNPSPKKEVADQYHFTYVALKKLLAESDIISLHVPLLPETYHMINKKNIRLIKKGAYIINTARGALIDPEALVWALETDHIAGAGLDVLETEEFLQHPQTFFFSEAKDRHTGANKALTSAATKVSLMNEILIDHPRTIVTPHNAFNSTEAVKRILDTTVENIRAFAAGKPQNVVR